MGFKTTKSLTQTADSTPNVNMFSLCLCGVTNVCVRVWNKHTLNYSSWEASITLSRITSGSLPGFRGVLIMFTCGFQKATRCCTFQMWHYSFINTSAAAERTNFSRLVPKPSQTFCFSNYWIIPPFWNSPVSNVAVPLVSLYACHHFTSFSFVLCHSLVLISVSAGSNIPKTFT